MGREGTILGFEADGHEGSLDVGLESEEGAGAPDAEPQNARGARRGEDAEALGVDSVRGMASGDGPERGDDAGAGGIVDFTEELEREVQ